MTEPEAVRIESAGIELSGLLCRPLQAPARALVVALPGGGVSAGYWDCPPRPLQSFMRLGAELGFCVLALDRPGYGASRDYDPARLDLASQVERLFDAVEAWRGREAFDGGSFVIGHSVGGIVALMMAAHARAAGLAGIDVLGVPFRYPASAAGVAVRSMEAEGGCVPVVTRDTRRWLLFGPEGSYHEDAFDYDGRCSRPMPSAEYRDGLAAPALWKDLLPAIRVPVQWTATEFEKMQVTGRDMLDEVQTLLRNSPHCQLHLQCASGHNASQHRIARAYHLRAYAFFEECLALAA